MTRNKRFLKKYLPGASLILITIIIYGVIGSFSFWLSKNVENFPLSAAVYLKSSLLDQFISTLNN